MEIKISVSVRERRIDGEREIGEGGRMMMVMDEWMYMLYGCW